MYINQIDKIIDNILNKLYDELNDNIIKENNFVDYHNQINEFIQKFFNNLDLNSLGKLIINKENLQKIFDIIKRLIYYYYFLLIAYYYKGTIKEFRNNLIQFSKLQGNSFFNTDDNYTILILFKLIKDVSKIILMTEFQLKTLNKENYKDAIQFLNDLGKNYIDNYLLTIITKNNDQIVEINIPNLIKTIVLDKIYKKEQHTVYEILNDNEEIENEYIYIDVIVEKEKYNIEIFKEVFLGYEDKNNLINDLIKLIDDENKIPTVLSLNSKNNLLFQLPMFYPIVDDFLRYSKDNEQEIENNNILNLPLINDNSKNVQTALLYQQRKNKEDIKAKIIINKIDAISDLYSNIKPEYKTIINNYFKNSFGYRKAVLMNYNDEVHIFQKIINQGKKGIEDSEYFIELDQIIHQAYFNFKNFQKNGISLYITADYPINLIRYDNIENNVMNDLELDIHTNIIDNPTNIIGFIFQPFKIPIQCIKKKDLLNIRDIKIKYKEKEYENQNGYKMFMKIIKHFFINTIEIKDTKLYHNFFDIHKLNPHLHKKAIYWIYDVDKDDFTIDHYDTNSQDIIKLLNATLYDRIIYFLKKRLSYLIQNNKHLSLFHIESLVIYFNSVYNLNLSYDEQKELIHSFLYDRKINPNKLITFTNKLPMPLYTPNTYSLIFRIQIDMLNPNQPHPYFKLGLQKEQNSIISREKTSCIHEDEWNIINKNKNGNLNNFNILVTQFIEKYVVQSVDLYFICNICGQILPLKQYLQDGNYNLLTQKYITNYTPINTPLDQILEYQPYPITIKFLDVLISRVSFITSTNMLIGLSDEAEIKRKGMIKIIIDIIIKHNTYNLNKNENLEKRLEYFSKNFNINKELDIIIFFELNDSIFNFTHGITSTNIDLDRLKYNNILLYFLLIFVTEFTGPQIYLMAYDKIANIFIFEKHSDKLFGNLLIKTNVNDMDTKPIIEYPVLCYLIFLVSYYLIKYNLWYYEDNKTFNPIYQKIIINSIVDLFNGISMDSLKKDYVYSLVVNKLYTQLNTTFINKSIINQLKIVQAKYGKDYKIAEEEEKQKNLIETYLIKPSFRMVLIPYKFPNFKISTGIQFDRVYHLMYPNTKEITDITNCPQGTYHEWKVKEKEIYCTICGEIGKDRTGKIIRLDEAYYHILNKIAKLRCQKATMHDFKNEICNLCHKNKNEKYTETELKTMEENIIKIRDENFEKKKIKEEKKEKKEKLNDENNEKLFDKIIKEKSVNLIDILEKYIGNTDLGIEKYPVYLKNNIYIIDHSYDGSLLKEPLIIKDTENLIMFDENNSFFKTDVYYYINKRTQTNIYYQAISLRLLGYKEKHKDYIKTNYNVYLKIIPSIEHQLKYIGYETQYINFEKSNYETLDNLIKAHILKIKTIIGQFYSIISRIRYYFNKGEVFNLELETAKELNLLTDKYAVLLKDFHIKNDFDDWNIIKYMFTFEPIDWKKLNLILPTKYINSNIINLYDKTSNKMMTYLINKLILLLNNNSEKINICMMYIEIIHYLYNLYNIDSFKNSLDLKRFTYIINGPDITIDLLKKGQGITKLQEENWEEEEKLTEEQQEELEDLKEEAEALDIEGDYFFEEDADIIEE